MLRHGLLAARHLLRAGRGLAITGPTAHKLRSAGATVMARCMYGPPPANFLSIPEKVCLALQKQCSKTWGARLVRSPPQNCSERISTKFAHSAVHSNRGI